MLSTKEMAECYGRIQNETGLRYETLQFLSQSCVTLCLEMSSASVFVTLSFPLSGLWVTGLYVDCSEI